MDEVIGRIPVKCQTFPKPLKISTAEIHIHFYNNIRQKFIKILMPLKF